MAVFDCGGLEAHFSGVDWNRLIHLIDGVADAALADDHRSNLSALESYGVPSGSSGEQEARALAIGRECVV